jgi:hypothetical protein
VYQPHGNPNRGDPYRLTCCFAGDDLKNTYRLNGYVLGKQITSDVDITEHIYRCKDWETISDWAIIPRKAERKSTSRIGLRIGVNLEGVRGFFVWYYRRQAGKVRHASRLSLCSSLSCDTALGQPRRYVFHARLNGHARCPCICDLKKVQRLRSTRSSET